ncbi:MFS transporter [Roseobacter sp. N2S]|uniref:MFS transporter n=1 Tax=Roseobacter sp. N2S TaxID=2663844 RepID=UPI002866F261|nr:MFS transporter [Roseobacter sp. N2S]MDR6265598.1 MFS family permease [Roseobacter sp. N2S]
MEARKQSAPAWVPLVITITLVQAVLALMSRTLPLFGMPLTQSTGMEPEAVGQLSSATSLGSMLFFLWGPALLARLPSIRQLQLGCALSAAAMLFCAAGHWQGLLLAAFVIGLGYGPSAPAGSDLLMRVTPKRRRATIFSIKQAGVPLGGLAAGLVLPAIAAHFGGVGAALTTAALLALAAAAALGFWKGTVEDAPTARPAISFRHMLLAPVRLMGLLLRSRQLRLITAAGFCLGIAQGVIMGFFPVFLSDHAGWSLVASGAAFAVLQALGVGGRVVMGWLSDRIADPIRALAGLCFASGLTMLLLTTIGPTSSTVWVVILSALAGITVVSWNGVFLTGLAETAPEGRVGEITAGGTFVLFGGYVLCPLLMQALVTLTGGYATGLILAGLAPAAAGAALTFGARRHSA